MSWTWVLGVLLLIWAGRDLYTGTTWAHRRFSRDQEPGAYWVTISVWLAVGISCFFW